jgi:transcriptional regulator with XRE-family HTH domain
LFNIDTPDRHMDTAIPEKERAAPAATLPHPVPLPVQRAIEKLGNDLALARRRRRISQQSLATRIGASVSTVKRMEKGDMRVPLHFIARSLHVFGELDRLVSLLDSANDEIGLTLADEALPKRIRSRIRHPPDGAL